MEREIAVPSSILMLSHRLNTAEACVAALLHYTHLHFDIPFSAEAAGTDIAISRC